MVSLKTGPSKDRMYFDPDSMLSSCNPFLHVVIAGGLDVVSVHVSVTLLASRVETIGSPSGKGSSDRVREEEK